MGTILLSHIRMKVSEARHPWESELPGSRFPPGKESASAKGRRDTVRAASTIELRGEVLACIITQMKHGPRGTVLNIVLLRSSFSW